MEEMDEEDGDCMRALLDFFVENGLLVSCMTRTLDLGDSGIDTVSFLGEPPDWFAGDFSCLNSATAGSFSWDRSDLSTLPTGAGRRTGGTNSTAAC